MVLRLWRIRGLIKLGLALWISSVRLAWRCGILLARLDLARARVVRAVSPRGGAGQRLASAPRSAARSVGASLLSALTGAGAMYFLDPAEGRRRRARALARSQQLVRRSAQAPAGMGGNGHAIPAGAYAGAGQQLPGAPEPGGPASAPWGASQPASEPENGHGST
jgi:hypothetical protein